MDKKRTMTVNCAALPELAALDELITVVERADDYEIANDILNFTKIDLIIMNIVGVAAESALNLAIAAQKSSIDIICLIDRKNASQSEFAALAGCGVHAFVDIRNLYEIEQYVKSYPDSFDFSSLVSDTAPKPDKFRIAVLGIISRIGTTTMAIDLATHLKKQNYKVCIVDIDNSIDAYKAVYDLKSKDDYTILAGIPVYSEAAVPKALSMRYDCYIYDYGVALKNKNWTDKDKIIVCCGDSPAELVAFSINAPQVVEASPFYIFSLVDERRRKKILDQMSGSAAKTFFAGYKPNPLDEVTQDFWSQIIGLDKTTKPSLLRKFFKR